MLLALWTAALLGGCAARTSAAGGAGAPSVPLFRFPDQPTLDRLAASAAPAGLPPPEETNDLREWELLEGLPERVGIEPEAETELVSDAPAMAALREGVTRSRAATCVAREVARMMARTGAGPSPRMSTWIEGRCGLAAAMVTLVGLRSSGLVPESELLSRLDPTVGQALAAAPPGARLSVGIGASSTPDGSAVAAAIAQHVVELEPFSPVVTAGAPGGPDGVVVRGRLLPGVAGTVHGVITAGSRGVERCERGAVAPPRFALRCPVLRADATAWLQLELVRPGRLLAGSAATILVRRGEERAIHLPPAATPGAGDATGAGRDRPLIELLNDARRRGGLRPLRLAEAQSAEHSRLVTTYFQAVRSGDTATADTVALGLLAGHRVTGGTVRRGDIATGWVFPTRDVRDWLDWALMLPMTRQPLLDPFASELAFGQAAGPGEHGGIAAIAATFRLFDPRDAPIDAEQVLRRLWRERRALGRRTTHVTRMPRLAEAAAAVREGRLSPTAAAQEAADGIAEALGVPVQVHSVEALDLEAFPFPPALLAGRSIGAAVELAYHRPPGAAWGQHVILVAVLGGR